MLGRQKSRHASQPEAAAAGPPIPTAKQACEAAARRTHLPRRCPTACTAAPPRWGGSSSGAPPPAAPGRLQQRASQDARCAHSSTSGWPPHPRVQAGGHGAHIAALHVCLHALLASKQQKRQAQHARRTCVKVPGTDVLVDGLDGGKRLQQVPPNVQHLRQRGGVGRSAVRWGRRRASRQVARLLQASRAEQRLLSCRPADEPRVCPST